MSVSSMTNAAFARRADEPPANQGLSTVGEVAANTGEKPTSGNPVTSALQAIVTYIPTEIVTVYVAVLATIGGAATAAAAGAEAATPIEVFLVFILLTPLVTWGLYATKAVTAGKGLPLSLAAWPKWEMAAGTISFAVWGAALPQSPLERFDWFSIALAGVVALVVSMLLGVFAPLFSRAPLAAK
jgi:hypothetical protein